MKDTDFKLEQAEIVLNEVRRCKTCDGCKVMADGYFNMCSLLDAKSLESEPLNNS